MNRIMQKLSLVVVLIAISGVTWADNPMVSHIYTADPTARVFNDRVYVYASHDEDNQTSYAMLDYHVFSSDDMVNWQDHGVALDVADVDWATTLYAPDAVYRNGKYYLYFPDGGRSIGVATSDTPYGPFVDALGKPLVTNATPGAKDVDWVFDPSVFIDDDGQAYLYFGGGFNSDNNLRVVKLKSNMIELDGRAIKIDQPNFFEGAFVHKRNGTYYMSYPRKPGSDIVYMTSDDPVTGWVDRGVVLPNPPNNEGRNSHHSMVEFKNQWYMFYHNRKVARDRGASNSQWARSINVDYLNYNRNGTIRQVVPTTDGVTQLKKLNAYARNEAEMFDREKGIETEFSSEGGVNIGYLSDGDWVKYAGVNFGSGASKFTARVASASIGGIIELHLNSPNGPMIGSCTVRTTGGWQQWRTISCDVDGATGTKDLYLKFVGSATGLFNINWWRFERPRGFALDTRIIGASFNGESHPRDNRKIRKSDGQIAFITPKSWVRYNNVNFASGAKSIDVRASSDLNGGTIEVRTGSSTGPLLGSVKVTNTGGWSKFKTFKSNLKANSGVHDLFFVFTEGGGKPFLFNVKSFVLQPSAQ